jgi:long-chain acyl-CoA synthetase
VAPSPLEEQLALSPLIDQVVLYGANKPYNVALVVPSFEALARWAESEGLATRTPEALVLEPRVHAKVGEELTKYSGTFKAYERPKRWALLSEPMTTDNGQLTPTLKPKRRVIVARYEREIAELYSV